MTLQPHIEFARFRLAPGVTEEQMIRLSDQMQTDLQGVPGYLSRMLMKQGPGQFADVLFWRSAGDCAAAMQTFPQSSQACAAYLQCTVSVTPEHPEQDMVMLSPVKAYGSITLGA